MMGGIRETDLVQTLNDFYVKKVSYWLVKIFILLTLHLHLAYAVCMAVQCSRKYIYNINKKMRQWTS